MNQLLIRRFRAGDKKDDTESCSAITGNTPRRLRTRLTIMAGLTSARHMCAIIKGEDGRGEDNLILQSAFSQQGCSAAAAHEASFAGSQQRAIENQKYIGFSNLQVASRETRCSLSSSRIARNVSRDGGTSWWKANHCKR